MNSISSAPTILLLLSLASCGGGDGGSSVDIVGKSPEAAAEEFAESLCRFETSCTDYTINCQSVDDVTTCTVEEEEAESLNECLADLQPGIYEDLLCADLTAAQEQLLNTCINDIIAAGCPPRSFFEEQAEKIEQGEDTDDWVNPPECEQVFSVIEANCEDTSELSSVLP